MAARMSFREKEQLHPAITCHFVGAPLHGCRLKKTPSSMSFTDESARSVEIWG